MLEIPKEFIEAMNKELKDNAHKGNWQEFAIKENRIEILNEFYHHLGKLSLAIKEEDENLIKEYSADVANIAMFMFKSVDT